MESPTAPSLSESTISLSKETIVAIFRTHIESIVENVVSSVIAKFPSKLEALEHANTQLINENSKLKATIGLK
ncbi:hypothetical protein DPMN_180745 [Dreissena polymorpha]|uniref:Uncharacterized protein n=1 Tax=Dreissena polymorpha TaxID=45954 RepID=A0A9D4DCY6_DREPO|nr:hypothetical protein DPMN_180745 [Dreissena polymorpha]